MLFCTNFMLKNTLTAPQLLALRLAPLCPALMLFPACCISVTCAFGTLPSTDIFLLHPQSSIFPVCGNKVK